MEEENKQESLEKEELSKKGNKKIIKGKSLTIYIVIIIVIAMALTFGSGFLLGKVLYEEKKEEPKQEEKKDNSVKQNQKTDEELIKELTEIINTVRSTYDQQTITDELRNLESTYFTENGRSELQVYSSSFEWYCLDVAACTTEEHPIPESVFNSTDAVHGEYSILERNENMVVLKLPIYTVTTSEPEYNHDITITFKKENDTWKIDKFIN